MSACRNAPGRGPPRAPARARPAPRARPRSRARPTSSRSNASPATAAASAARAPPRRELRGAHQHGVADRVGHRHLAAVRELEPARALVQRVRQRAARAASSSTKNGTPWVRSWTARPATGAGAPPRISVEQLGRSRPRRAAPRSARRAARRGAARGAAGAAGGRAAARRSGRRRPRDGSR